MTNVDTLKFTDMHLVIEGNSPDIDILNPLFETDSDSHEFKDKSYKVSLEKTDLVGSFSLYSRYGKERPYSPTVTHKETQQEEKNPRKYEQIELGNQLFCYYSKSHNSLLLSDSRQKGFIEDYLQKKLKKDTTIKNFFVDPDEFIEEIKKVSEIKFVTKRSLFNPTLNLMDIVNNPQDLFGLGSDGTYSLGAKFRNVGKTDKFVQFFRDFFSNPKKDPIGKLLCTGLNDDNVETIFNVDKFTHKIEIACVKDANGMYESSKIFDDLITRVEGGKNEKKS